MMENENINLKKIIKTSVVCLVVLITLLCSFKTIRSGEIGLKVRFGKIIDIQLNEGFNWKLPFIEKIVKVNIKVQKSEVNSNAATKDLQDVDAIVAVNYSVDGMKASSLYKNVGSKYDEVVLQPAIQESIKSVISKYSSEEVITKRSEVSNMCMETLQNKVAKYGITIDNFNIINFNFSDAYSLAIEQKQVAEQQVLKAKQELEKAKIDADIKIAEARAEAESLKVQKQEISKDLLELRRIEAQLKAIEKWNGSLPTYYSGNGLPFISIK